jgi:hypothetical protein
MNVRLLHDHVPLVNNLIIIISFFLSRVIGVWYFNFVTL